MRRCINGLILIILLVYGTTAFAAKADTINTFSTSMQKNIKAVVITPKKYSKNKKYPVVYLLHGYSGNYADWVKTVPAIKDYSDLYSIIIVCPDGNYNSWYIDSPEKKESMYDTYISKELVQIIDKLYSTLANREGRAITGLSMGGHGALSLAIKHQDVFANAGSMSGGLDLQPFEKNWEIANYLGAKEQYPDRWAKYSVVNLINNLNSSALNLIIECGKSDFFYGVNNDVHKKLEEKDISHTYISSPGGHTWQFWANAVQYQLLFFSNHFKKSITLHY